MGSLNARIHGIEVSIQRVQAYVTDQLVVDLQKALTKASNDVLGDKSLDSFALGVIQAADRTLGLQIQGAEQHASKLVANSMEQAKELVSHSVAEISAALTHQRSALLEVDVEKLAITLDTKLRPIAADIRRETQAARRTAMFIGLAVAVANFLGIWIGSFVGHR